MTFYTIHPRELEDIMRRKHGILIDVREADSYREYHYPNARNLPYEKIDQWMHRLPKNRPLVLYCDYGSTSLLAARKLGREGYEVYTIVGGIKAMRTSD
ncbi:MAG: rhodanese-like domain-containing protein [Roseburia hominis]|uniref:rhodanese-like domain-containing protein n=1 Tax=Roseburia hominis TaxID=301301 RepID=UPI00290843ED|nr:rhodanese-like domain-containing protein [Roseburia hominis]MDU6922482.1 rhodanese-like domain-containing protein [Roseburia hominis]